MPYLRDFMPAQDHGIVSDKTRHNRLNGVFDVEWLRIPISSTERKFTEAVFHPDPALWKLVIKIPLMAIIPIWGNQLKRKK